jgi:acetoin utilization deacetylase AcuC-like enzyme
MLIYYDPLCLKHDTGSHPENAGRLKPLEGRLDDWVVRWGATRPKYAPATLDQLKLVHAAGYIDSIREACEAGGRRLDPDTVTSPMSYEAARLASGAVVDAVTRVVGGEDRIAFCAVRPPGHHALRDRAMGFCLFNHVAVGAAVATRTLGLSRVLIVDWDVHHGNGTQAIFWEDPQVGFFSMHRYPFYPGSGAADETGAGAGAGMTRNLPISFGTPPDKIMATFRESLVEFAACVKPELVLISAGFDAHREDDLGQLALVEDDYAWITRQLVDVAERHAGGRLVSCLEGGYSLSALARSVAAHLRVLADVA